MAGMKDLIYSTGEYTRSYSDFRGVRVGADCSADTTRLAYAENMYRDYITDTGGAIESIPGFRKILSLGAEIFGIYKQKCSADTEYLLIHAGTGLYRMPISLKDGKGSCSRIGTLKASMSRAFSYGSYFYILNGNLFYRVDEGGSLQIVASPDVPAYVPTLYVQGEPYEQRNLLTDAFREELFITDASNHIYASDELLYLVIDSELKKCAAVGVTDSFKGELHIPGRVRLGEDEYRVYEIADNAFAYNTNITSVKINEGVQRIGKFAFRYATEITEISTPNSLTEIDNAAFADTRGMTDLYLGTGLKTLGSSILSTALSLSTVHYALGESDFAKITNYSQINTSKMSYNDTDTALKLMFKVYSDAFSITNVRINDKYKTFSTVKEDGKVKRIIINVDDPTQINGKTLTVSGIALPYISDFDGSDKTDTPTGINGFDAILGCKICEVFDGRIFLAGNPALPNTVFFSTENRNGGRDPLYFGHLDYFNDGVGQYAVNSLLAVRDSLAVFKEGDDGSGSIFYHSPADTSENLVPRIYPRTSVHSGICSYGQCISFFDDPLFISEVGVCALELRQLNYDRSIVPRSSNVNLELMKEKLSDASLAIWLGYLAVCVGGRIYLADSRKSFSGIGGNKEYEWFILDGIGTYKNSTRVYRYCSSTSESLDLSDSPDEKCSSTVYSYKNENGDTVYYSAEKGKKYAVYPTEEKEGGDFSEATVLYSDGELLFFGTKSGDLCVFNNDKRGAPPSRIANSDGFDPAEYSAAMGNRIHPDFYDFDGHAPRYAIKTCLDNCGIPHLTKNTVKNSLTVKCKSYAATVIHCEVGTDRSGYSEVASFSAAALDFDELCFDRLTITSADHYTLPLGEKEKNWIEKQLTFYSNEFRCPIGIYSITFRYKIKGKIKKN